MPDVLIVEDGLAERNRLLKLFAEAGYSASGVDSVESAETLISVEQFRLCILDIGLSDRSGSVLFEKIRRSNRIPYIIILTGNPSIHLKQRFLEQGASAYIVKASLAAGNESLLNLIRSLLGQPSTDTLSGIALEDFLRQYVTPESRALFMDSEMKIIPCKHCGANSYLITFTHRTQLPPLIEGKVLCARCKTAMDPEVG